MAPKTESRFKLMKKEQNHFSELSNSPISYPSDSPYITGGQNEALLKFR